MGIRIPFFFQLVTLYKGSVLKSCQFVLLYVYLTFLILKWVKHATEIPTCNQAETRKTITFP